MEIKNTSFEDVKIFIPKVYSDHRGFFMETFNHKQFQEEVGDFTFVQDNHSKSSKGVLRGLHYQVEHPQGKLIRCTQGLVYDIMVDLRKSSSTFGKWFGIHLDKPNFQIWVPPGLAHGFYTLSDTAELEYKTTDYYYTEHERTLLWNDSQLNIDWELVGNPILSSKDEEGKLFEECEKYE